MESEGIDEGGGGRFARAQVGVNQAARVDITLKAGSASETVEVTSAAPLLQTEPSSLGTIETERRISELPLNGRNFIQLAYLGPESLRRPNRVECQRWCVRE